MSGWVLAGSDYSVGFSWPRINAVALSCTLVRSCCYATPSLSRVACFGGRVTGKRRRP
jgi:hypothetical protein